MSWRHHAPLPVVEGIESNPELSVVEHTVGYTEVVLSNGDRLRLRLYVDHFRFDPAEQTFAPTYRVVTEIQPRVVTGAQLRAALAECWRC